MRAECEGDVAEVSSTFDETLSVPGRASEGNTSGDNDEWLDDAEWLDAAALGIVCIGPQHGNIVEPPGLAAELHGLSSDSDVLNAPRIIGDAGEHKGTPVAFLGPGAG